MKTDKLVFATNNAHKLQEVRSMIGSSMVLLSLADIGCEADIPETGNTFEANARQKSDYLYKHYGMDGIGDDSGLEIEALHGEPGVYSARYSGTRDMQQNIALVLDKLAAVKQGERRARFRTVVSLLLCGQQYFFEGVVKGHITAEQRGVGGFGYDPIFIPEGHSRTFAEMSAAEKNEISHRAIAIKKLVSFLRHD